MAGSENTIPEVAPFAKPLSIPGVHFGSATNFKINLNFGNTIIDKLALRYCSNHANWMIFPEWVHAAYLTC